MNGNLKTVLNQAEEREREKTSASFAQKCCCLRSLDEESPRGILCTHVIKGGVVLVLQSNGFEVREEDLLLVATIVIAAAALLLLLSLIEILLV